MFGSSSLEITRRQQSQTSCDYGVQNYDELLYPERLRGLTRQMREVEACIPLEVGETRATASYDNSPIYDDPTQATRDGKGVEQKYAVTNLGNDTYQIDLALNFFAYDHGRIARMNRKVKECLEEANTRTSDRLGRKLIFKMHTPAEAAQIPVERRPPLRTISISEDDNIRGHSTSYNVNFSCATVLHELLHLMGLHDEYEETHLGEFVHNETGRIVAADPRGNSFNTEFNRLLTQHHQGALEGYTFHPSYACRSVPSHNTIMQNNHTYYPAVMAEDNTGPDRLYMFEPAHVERILYPQCRTKAQRYLRCARQAYSEARTACDPKPSFCEDDTWLTDLRMIRQ